MWAELKAAARAGLVWGVQIGVALLVVMVLLSWALGDYNQIRQRALNGQLAYEYLQRQAQAASAGAAK